MSEPNDLEARKNELFATMTLIKAAKRDLAVAQANGGDQLPLIDRLADLESERERLAHEVNSQYMYRNLQTFMSRVDSYDTARKDEAGGILAVVEETARGLGKLGGEFEEFRAESIARHDATEAWRAEVDKRLIADGERMSKIEKDDRDDIRTEIKSTNAKIASMEEMLKRYDSDLKELVDRLAARGGDSNA